ncbi:AraC-type DNA-binding protein [Actinopolymorpha cephalotaxi]|uniref:AraC-like DNA-binding protein n=1 Tax=Actinopolymorpha cephalotaxi TaxID=504797 RepID=A0A1I2PBM4_9ACTN|nr:AraC family transcriptional regulator [Actinopolymorpha cephalotaxi]NYH83672.1 AraC-like DNA-binding protein [Actinopolymorpha cephalotaxi]SFG13528.1 AraC-type DNA-binding protein [Actinopolymorpha cephalotaxi]
MDALSQLVAAMRTGEPDSFLVTHRAPWHHSYSSVQGSGIHVILQGSAVLLLPGAEPVPLGVGDVVLTPRGAAHALADSPTTPLSAPGTAAEGDGPPTVLLCAAYRMDRSRVHPMLSELPEYVHLPARPGRDPSLRAAIDLLGHEVQERQPGSDAAIPALLDTLLLFALRAWTEGSDCDEGRGWAAALRDHSVSAALSAIHRNPGHPWTVESLGVEAGLSRAAFARRFAAIVGQPPLAYLTWWRLATAARLLRETDSSLHTVAQRVGYASEFAFANAFKREFGTAPGAYRRQ